MRLAFVCSLIVLAGAAEAQENYSVSLSANQVTRLERVRVFVNEEECKAANLPVSCTQADLCLARGLGACSDAQARAAGFRIYPATQAGREELFMDTAREQVLELEHKANKRDFVCTTLECRQKACDSFAAMTTRQKDTVCFALGLSAGCSLDCP